MFKHKEKMEYFQGYDLRNGMYLRPNADDIERIEALINSKLPEDYLDFLVHYGGFGLRYDAFFPFQTVTAVEDTSGVEVFYGVMPGDAYDLESYYKTFEGRIPRNLMPIAGDQMGGQICLSISGEDKGSVYFWDNQFEKNVEEGKEPGYSNVYLLAESFDGFINSLILYKDEDDDE
jgi:SMI1-KNR4 cell-wall